MKKNSQDAWVGKVIVGLVVFVVAAVWLGTRLLGGPSASTDAGQIQVTLATDPNPPQLGKGTLTIGVHDASGQPVDDAKVSFDLNMTTMNMGRQSGTAAAQGGGKYAAYGNFTMRGPWRVSTTVKTAAGVSTSKDFIMTVP